MGLFERLKRRLPLVGKAASPRPASSAPSPYLPPEDDEPKSPRGEQPVAAYIEELIKGNAVVLFMKGSPDSPQCGFSATATGILRSYGVPFAHVNVLADPDVREGVKQFSNWPTIPQIFINGEFIGGSDILQQLHAAGDLRQLVHKDSAT